MSDARSPLVDGDGALRVRRFAAATASAAVVITVLTAVALRLTAPVDTWPAAFGLGAMMGFWVCPLLGALIGNGYHEIMADRARAQQVAGTVGGRTGATQGRAVPVPAAG